MCGRVQKDKQTVKGRWQAKAVIFFFLLSNSLHFFSWILFLYVYVEELEGSCFTLFVSVVV